jgi:hypothetical protein
VIIFASFFILIKIIYVNIYGYLNLLALSRVAPSYFFYSVFLFFISNVVRLRRGHSSCQARTPICNHFTSFTNNIKVQLDLNSDSKNSPALFGCARPGPALPLYIHNLHVLRTLSIRNSTAVPHVLYLSAIVLQRLACPRSCWHATAGVINLSYMP